MPDGLRAGLLFCCLALLALSAAAAAPQKSARPNLRKEYALIFGTVWSKQNRAVYGARVKIRRAGDRKPGWELISDRNGEFAQRLPAGKAEYEVWIEDTRQVSHPDVARRKYKPGEVKTTVHIERDERIDISLHLTE